MNQPPLHSSEPIIVGRIIKAHGVSGEVRAKILSDVPHRFNAGQDLHIRGERYHVASSRRVPADQVILKLQGVDSQSAARGLVGEHLTVPEESVPDLPEGEYFHFQLLGLRVITEDGEQLGRLSEILETGANDVYIVSDDVSELLIPALAEVILDVRLSDGTMLVRLPEGLR